MRCEFVDEDRTEILGHGYTDAVDGEPTYENAVVIGFFTKAYIEEIISEDGGSTTVCIGEGEIDAQCYHNYVKKLEKDVAKGIYPVGSIEIMRTGDNEGIVYKYGYKDEGRIPTIFAFSGYAFVGVTPADDSAKLIELNEKNKEDSLKMNEMEIKGLIAQVVGEMTNHTSEVNTIKETCEQKLTEATKALTTVTDEKNELEATVAELKAALDKVNADYNALDRKWMELRLERDQLSKALAEAQAKERINELKASLAEFSEDEKAVVKDEVAAFEKDPTSCEINAIVSKVWENIGKKAKTQMASGGVSETSALKDSLDDIFGEVVTSTTEDVNIF